MFGRFNRGEFNNYKNLTCTDDLDCYLFKTKYGFVDSYENILELINNLAYYSLKKGLNEEIKKSIIEIVSIFNNIKSLVLDDLSNIDIDDMLERFNNLNLDSINEDIKPTLKKYEIKNISKKEFDDFKQYEKDKLDWSKVYTDIKIPDSIGYINSYADGINENIIFSKDNLTGWGIIIKRESNPEEAIFKNLEKMFNSLGRIPLETIYSFQDLGLLEISPLGLHIEIIQGLNLIVRALNYLLNSNSYKNNEYLLFDKLEIDKSIKGSKIIIKRAVEIIKSQRKTVGNLKDKAEWN